MKQTWLFRVLMIFFCLTFLVSAFFLARYFWQGYQQKQQTNALADIVEQAKNILISQKDPSILVVEKLQQTQQKLSKNLEEA